MTQQNHKTGLQRLIERQSNAKRQPPPRRRPIRVTNLRRAGEGYFSDPGFEDRVREELHVKARARGVDLAEQAKAKAAAKRARKAAKRRRESER